MDRKKAGWLLKEFPGKNNQENVIEMWIEELNETRKNKNRLEQWSNKKKMLWAQYMTDSAELEQLSGDEVQEPLEWLEQVKIDSRPKKKKKPKSR